jgi:hypothetical protein
MPAMGSDLFPPKGFMPRELSRCFADSLGDMAQRGTRERGEFCQIGLAESAGAEALRLGLQMQINLYLNAFNL